MGLHTVTQDYPRRTCKYCGESFLGRLDKQFCDSECRIAWHNRIYLLDNRSVRSINQTLLKNRRILKQIYASGILKAKRADMAQTGYAFRYFTSQETRADGSRVTWVYDYGFRECPHKQDLEIIEGWLV